MRPVAVVTALLIAVGALTTAGCGGGPLSEKPERYSSAPSFEAAPSTVGALVSAQLSQLGELLDARIPKSFSAKGHGADVCVQHLWKDCAGTKYEFKAKKSGGVEVSALDARTLRLQGAIEFSGKGGFRGDVAKAIKADAKRFEGTLALNVDVKVDIDDEWCPVIKAAVGYDWHRVPKVEIVDGIWVNIENQVGEPLDKALKGLEEQLQNAVDCSLFRDGLASAYRAYTFPVDLPTGSRAHVNITPSGIGFSGLSYSADEARFTAAIRANAEVADHAIEASQLPLPAPETISILEAGQPRAPRITLAVPVRAPYETLEKELEAAIGDGRFAGETPAGQLEIVVGDIEVYPSGDKIAVGVRVRANLPTRLFDTRGVVYLVGKPVVTEGSRVHIEDLAFSRQLDNEFWSVATALFEAKIVEALESAASVDLASRLEASKTAIEKAVTGGGVTPGLAVQLQDLALGIGRVVPGEAELVVEGILSASASVSVEPTVLAKGTLADRVSGVPRGSGG